MWEYGGEIKVLHKVCFDNCEKISFSKFYCIKNESHMFLLNIYYNSEFNFDRKHENWKWKIKELNNELHHTKDTSNIEYETLTV